VTPTTRPQTWMGHKRIDETMLYVHVAEHHRRAIPEDIAAAAQGEPDPDRRILRMLGARAATPVTVERATGREDGRGKNVPGSVGEQSVM